jgi:hypothetical protein
MSPLSSCSSRPHFSRRSRSRSPRRRPTSACGGPSVACSATPYHAHDALYVWVPLARRRPTAGADDDDDDSSLSDFAQSPTEVLTDAARVRMRDEQSRGTNSGTILHTKPNAPSITARIVVVADTATAGADSLQANDAPPVSRSFPISSPTRRCRPARRPTFRLADVCFSQWRAGVGATVVGAELLAMRAPMRRLWHRAASWCFRRRPTRAATRRLPRRGGARCSRHGVEGATCAAGERRYSASAAVLQPPTSSSSPEEPTVPLHLSDRELLVRTASSGTQRALLFESSSSRTNTMSAAPSDEVCKTVTSNGTESCDEAESDNDAEDDDEDDDNDHDGEQFAQRQFESASSSPATPLRRRARRRVRRGRYRHAQRQQLPPSPLRRSLSAHEIEAATGPSKAAAAASRMRSISSSRALAVGDWRALRDPSGSVFYSEPGERRGELYTEVTDERNNSSNSNKLQK